MGAGSVEGSESRTANASRAPPAVAINCVRQPLATIGSTLSRATEALCDNDNHYSDEQRAYHGGLLDKFAESTNGTGCPNANTWATTTATP